jgi:hypothetical protein
MKKQTGFQVIKKLSAFIFFKFLPLSLTKKSFFALWQRRHVPALRLQNVFFDDCQNRL